MRNEHICCLAIILLIITGCKKFDVLPANSEPYAYDDYKTDPLIIERSLVDQGDPSRIIKAMQKARKGEDIVIGYMGGSITWGAAAKTRNESYATLVYHWWVKKFPSPHVKMINAGLSGTDSLLGIHRVNKDLLTRNPDFVVLEYAVNDIEGDMHTEAYENITREILLHDKQIGLIMLFMTLENGYNTQSDKVPIGHHYKIPMISFRDAIVPSLKSGQLIWSDISPDFIHPNSVGHEMVAEMIIYQLEAWYRQIDSDIIISSILPESLTNARYTNTEFYTNQTLALRQLGGFQIDDHAYWNLPLGWKAIDDNDPMIFEVTGKTIGLIYNQTTDNQGANVQVTIDDNEPIIVTSRSPYDYDYLYTHMLFDSGAAARHLVKIKLTETPPEGCSGKNFYLLGVLTSQ